MTARDDLRDIARMLDNVRDACGDGPIRLVGGEHAERGAAALRALADRLDHELADVSGDASTLAWQIGLALDRLDAPPQREPR